MMSLRTAFTEHVGIEVPLICGAMYPCSNPELVAAVSEAGGIGVVQPISMTFVHGHDLREGLRLIRRLTDRPIGFNALVEKSSRIYEDRMRRWVDVAIEEGVRFFITALGNPRWVVEKVHAAGGVVYHDVTTRDWAKRALDHSVDGLICVNGRAGGHAGVLSPERMMDELGDLGVPLICAGGIGDDRAFVRALDMGYAGAQLGTRFIATPECKASTAYKQAIVAAGEHDVVLTERLTGVPVAVIRNAYIERLGTKAGPLARWLLKGRKTKHWVRTWYALNSVRRLKRSLMSDDTSNEYWQAGKSVAGIREIAPAAQLVSEFAAALSHETERGRRGVP